MMLNLFLSQIVFFPAALLCFLPMRNKLRFSRLKTACIVVPTLLAAVTLFSWLGEFTLIRNIHEDILLVILFPLFLIAYYLCVKAPINQILSVFFAVVSLFSILTRITSRLYNVLTDSSPVGNRYQIVLIAVSFAAVAVLGYMFSKYGSFLIDRVDVPSVWYATIVFSTTVFVFSMLIKPIVEDPDIGKASKIYALLSQIVLLLFWLTMSVLFYLAVSELLRVKRLETENRILSMREAQFDSQQRYIKASERTRHDFRQTVRTLRELYDAGDMDTLGRYLHEYEQTIPVGEIRSFTENQPLNALLNFYQHVCVQNAIRFAAQVRIPAALPLSDVDLCTIIGNVLENAVMACKNTENRFIELKAITEDDAQLYIVATNSFDGNAQKKNDQYVSTKRKSGEGLGLLSVTSTVESYGGVARFSHDGSQFYSNIAVPLRKEPKKEL